MSDFQTPERQQTPAPRMAIIADANVPHGEAHFRDGATGALIGKIVQVAGPVDNSLGKADRPAARGGTEP